MTDEAKQVVKNVAVRQVTDEGVTKLKVYFSDAGKQPLTGDVRTSFETYMRQVGAAGTHYLFVSETPDELRVHLHVYYDALVLDSTGARLNGGGNPVEEAIEGYLNGLEYGGVMYASKLIDVIQRAEGVKDVTLEEVKIESNNDMSAVGGVVGSNTSCTLKACYAWGSVTGSGSGTIYVGGVTGSNDLGTLTACYHAKGTVSGPDGATGGVAGRNFKDSMFGGGIITACYWGGNGQEQGIGEDQVGTGGTTMVTDSNWSGAKDAMNDALQSAGSEWQYELTGALPTLKKQ